jgi:hypothetical protein
MWPKINGFFRGHKEELHIVLVVALVAILSFGLGRLSVYYGEKGHFQVVYPISEEGE